jgi:ribonuclease P protein component
MIEVNWSAFRAKERHFHETNLSAKQHQEKENARVPEPDGNARRTQGAETTSGQRPKTVDRYRAAETRSHLAPVNAKRSKEDFPKSARLRKRPEFLSLSRTGKKVHSQHFVVISRSNDRGESRLGITVSGKVGNAVARNRIKRVVREIFRTGRGELGMAVDILVVAKAGAALLARGVIEKEIKKSLNASRSR